MLRLSELKTSSSNQSPELMNLGIGEVQKRMSSYVGSTHEVNAMIVATKDRNKRWPGFWYELLQGALDKNDWSQGNPHIQVRLKKHPPVALDFADFLDLYQKRRIRIGDIQDVQVINYIKNGIGLRPRHISLTEHDVQGHDSETLGRYGRGLSIATTAALAGNLIDKISFVSCADGIGSWYGEGSLEKADVLDSTSPDALTLRYKRDLTLKLPQTVITVTSPKVELIESLVEFPNWFLPANPNYRFHRLTKPDDHGHIENMLTVFANPTESRQDKTDTNFTSYELSSWGLQGLDKVKATETPRVEILSRELFPSSSGIIDFVYVDGLKVEAPGSSFSQIWSFWGFGRGNDGYNPKRSNESISLVGNPRELVAKVLERNSNPIIFEQILQSSMDKTSCYESNIYSWSLSSMSKQASEALRIAWTKVKENLAIPDDAYITTSESQADRAKREKKKVVLLRSEAFERVLLKSVLNLEKVEAVFEREKLEAEKKHLEEIATKERVHRAEVERLEKEKEEAVIMARHARGIEQEARHTGETLKVSPDGHPEDTLEFINQHLLNILSLNKGMIKQSNGKGMLVLEIDGSDIISGLPTNSIQLGRLAPIIRDFAALLGDFVDMEIRTIQENGGIFFKFAKAPGIDQDGSITLQVEKGILSLKGNNVIRIEFRPKEHFTDLLESSSSPLNIFLAEYKKFYSSLEENIQAFLGTDGRVDVDKYLASEAAQKFPPLLEELNMKRKLAELRAQTQTAIEAENKRRKAAGLPEIIFEDVNPPSGQLLSQKKPVESGIGKVEQAELKIRGGEIIDDAPVVEKILHLVHPDSSPGLSKTGKGERSQQLLTERSILQMIEDGLRRNVSPDFTLISGEREKVRGYLISHINPAYSTTTTQEYTPLPGLQYGKQENIVTLRFNKPIKAGLSTLLCPPGFEPAGYFHRSGPVDLRISGNLDKNVYAFYLPEQASTGLTFYFRKHNRIDKTMPDAREVENVMNIEELVPHWRALVEELKLSSLSDKQKNDILLRAWTKAFTYSDTQETFDMYNRTSPASFISQIINYAEGNCGYAGRGLRALKVAVGLPTREVSSFLADEQGHFSLSSNYHLLNQTFIDDKWVLEEPQTGYLEPGYRIEEIPYAFRTRFSELLAAIPDKKYESPKQLLSNILPDILSPSPRTIRELIGIPEIRISTGGLLKVIAGTAGGAIIIPPAVRSLSDTISQYLRQMPEVTSTPSINPGLPIQEIAREIGQNLPPELIVFASLLGIGIGALGISGISYLGGYLHGRFVESRSSMEELDVEPMKFPSDE